jgi:5-methylcytosine-specific restriction protein A
MLSFVYDCSGHRSTASDIAVYFGVNQQKVTSDNRSLARRIYKELHVEPEKKNGGGERYWSVVYDEYHPNRDSNGHYWWVIRPELVSALESFYGMKKSVISHPQKGKNRRSESFKEGGAQALHRTFYERNPEARRECLEHYGYTCAVCGFNFENVYGEVGKGIICVHHKVPISRFKGEEHIVSPTEDLIPVCHNCHAIIH